MTRHAAIYTRISRDREGAGLGVGRQAEDCQALADRLGWTVVVHHDDNDLSAYSGKPRPGYRALLDDLREGRADAVLAWHADRLHRSPVELEEFITVCEQHAVEVQTVKAGAIDLSSPTGRMVARHVGVAARYEVEHAQERMRRAKAEAAAKGRWRGGRRPFGYTEDGRTVVAAEAGALRRAADDLLAGASLAAAARRMDADGIRTSTGGRIDAVNLRRLLLRPRNAGLIDMKGEIVGGADWPAIVPEDVWRGVLAVLADPTRTTTTGPERRWLGSGLYRCGVEGCGAVIRAAQGGRAPRRFPVYVCSTSKHLVRRVDQTDEVVDAVVRARLALPDLADLMAVTDDPARATEAQTQLIALRQRLSDLAVMFADGVLTASQLTDGTAAVQARMAAHERELARGGGVLAGVLAAPDPAAAWDAAPLDRRRSILDALAVVTVLPARRGRPAGWQPGEPYFDPNTIRVQWRTES